MNVVSMGEFSLIDVEMLVLAANKLRTEGAHGDEVTNITSPSVMWMLGCLEAHKQKRDEERK